MSSSGASEQSERRALEAVLEYALENDIVEDAIVRNRSSTRGSFGDIGKRWESCWGV